MQIIIHNSKSYTCIRRKLKRIQKLRSGFTLLELIVVIAIVGILAGVSTPKIIYSLNAGKLRGEANKILTTLRYAQGMAAMQRATYRIKFNLGNSEFNDEKKFAAQSYQLIRDESRNDDFEFSDNDLDRSSVNDMLGGQQRRGLPANDDFDYKEDKNYDDDYYEDENIVSNRNMSGPVDIFDKAEHKLPSGVKITKIIDIRDDFEITKGVHDIPINPKGRSIDSYIYLTSSGKNPSVYIVHIGMNGLSEAYLKDDD